MKKLLLFFILLSLNTSLLSQDKKGKPFFTGDINIGFGLNENYNVFDTLFDTEDRQTIFEPVAILVRSGFGYQFNKRWGMSINAGLDHHFKFEITAIPTYGSLRYNLYETGDTGDGDTIFLETSYGKMWQPTTRFKDGKYFGIGIGSQIAGSKRWNTIFRLDFHRKSIIDFGNNEHLDSVSLGIGFSFF